VVKEREPTAVAVAVRIPRRRVREVTGSDEMSDWCAYIEKKILESKKILVDDDNLSDTDFDRIVLQLHRMRRGLWKEGQI